MNTLDGRLPGQRLNLAEGTAQGGENSERYLSDLPGVFEDEQGYTALVADGNPLVYRVSSVESEDGAGALSYGLGWLAPGRVGTEYFLTRGHFHSRREAAEVYIGLAGSGLMLLEHEHTSECRAVELTPNSVVYVPGHTAHRTVNTGDVPLVYLGIYPEDAGHDYASIGTRNFRQVVVAGPDGPVVRQRQAPGRQK